MSLTLQFSIVTLNPSTYRCEIFHGPPYTDRELRGHIDPLQTVPLTPVNAAHTATFTANPGNGYALRLLNASGKVFARSNARTLASKQRLLVIEGTDRIAEATFGTFAPPVPFTEEKTTFDRLDLDFQGNDLRLFGHALHDGVFNKRFNLDYRFRVAPVDIPVWTPVTSLPEDDTPEDTLTIDTTSLTIDADRKRQAVLLRILKPIIRRKLRKTVQRRFHESILQRAAGAGALKPVITLRGPSVIDGGFVDLNIGIVGDAPG